MRRSHDVFMAWGVISREKTGAVAPAFAAVIHALFTWGAAPDTAGIALQIETLGDEAVWKNSSASK